MSLKKARAGNTKDPKEMEYQELIDLCIFPAPMDNEMLMSINPNEWKNVGPSLMHCSEVLLLKQKHNG